VTNWDPDLDLESGLLRNRLGITDPAELTQAESDITTPRMADLVEHPIEGAFDLDHLRAIHRFVFAPLYAFAGELRTVALGKGGHAFCAPEQLRERGDRILLALAARDHLRGLDRSAFLDGLTELLAALLWLHPFREGNGRSTRAFVAQLAAAAGHRLHWAGLDGEANRLASRAAHDGDLEPLRALLKRHLAR
jgi:cell filamentation protein